MRWFIPRPEGLRSTQFYANVLYEIICLIVFQLLGSFMVYNLISLKRFKQSDCCSRSLMKSTLPILFPSECNIRQKYAEPSDIYDKPNPVKIGKKGLLQPVAKHTCHLSDIHFLAITSRS